MNELFLEVFHNMPRQGPGTDDCTLQAFETLRPFLPIEPVALDMGCGTGASTMVLARHCKHVTAMDLDRFGSMSHCRFRREELGHGRLFAEGLSHVLLPCRTVSEESGCIEVCCHIGDHP